MVRYDKGPSSPLGASVVRSIDDAPFDRISLFVEASEDNGKIATTLFGGRADDPINVLQQHICGPFLPKDVIYLPPEHPFGALYPGRIFLHDGVILARKSAYQQVVVRYGVFGFRNVLANMLWALAEVRGITIKSILFSHGGLPLIRPHDLEFVGSSL